MGIRYSSTISENAGSEKILFLPKNRPFVFALTINFIA